MEELERAFVTQRQYGEDRAALAKELGDLKVTMANGFAALKWQRTLLAGVLIAILADLVVTLIKLRPGP